MLDADEVSVSAASIWEIAIKAKIGKIEGNPSEFLEAIVGSGFRELKISGKHAAKVQELPLHHRDPFDRLLMQTSSTSSGVIPWPEIWLTLSSSQTNSCIFMFSHPGTISLI